MQNKVVRFVLDLDPRAHVGQEQRKRTWLIICQGQGDPTKIERGY